MIELAVGWLFGSILGLLCLLSPFILIWLIMQIVKDDDWDYLKPG